jgi:glycerol kinase
MARYVGALDQGTTSTRFILFDRNGKPVASHQLEHRQIFPKAGWVEHDPMEIITKVDEVIAGTVHAAGATVADIAAVGITNQRETTVVWDRNTGQPFHNALVWQDTRTESVVGRMSAEGGADRFRELCGLPLSTYFSATKLVWLLENVPGLRAAAERGDALFGTVDSWALWHLSGGRVHVTDVTNAGRTMLMNIHTLEWDDELLRAFDIPRAMLPEIRPSSDPEAFGTLTAGGGSVPVTAVLGDQHAALFGQTCFSPGEAKNTYGTGCFMLLNTGEEAILSSHGLLTTLGYQLAGEKPVYALEGSVAIAGALVQWLRDNLGLIQSSADVEALAQGVPDNGGIYFVPAFSGLFAPYWRGDARGAIVGMTRFINRNHIARAALEATAYQTREVMDAMVADSGVPLQALKVDGGMTNNGLLMQFQADILNVPVVRPQVAETTALGAAYAAGLAVGFWTGLDELRANWHVAHEWTPRMPDGERDLLYAGWKKAVTRTFDWV